MTVAFRILWLWYGHWPWPNHATSLGLHGPFLKEEADSDLYEPVQFRSSELRKRTLLYFGGWKFLISPPLHLLQVPYFLYSALAQRVGKCQADVP